MNNVLHIILYIIVGGLVGFYVLALVGWAIMCVVQFIREGIRRKRAGPPIDYLEGCH